MTHAPAVCSQSPRHSSQGRWRLTAPACSRLLPPAPASPCSRAWPDGRLRACGNGVFCLLFNLCPWWRGEDRSRAFQVAGPACSSRRVTAGARGLEDLLSTQPAVKAQVITLFCVREGEGEPEEGHSSRGSPVTLPSPASLACGCRCPRALRGPGCRPRLFLRGRGRPTAAHLLVPPSVSGSKTESRSR